VLFGFKLNTWTKWSCVAMYTFVSTCIADFTSDSVGPWITNTIQDHKNMYLPYSKFTCVWIVQTFSMYAIIMGTIHLFVALSQIDFMLMRMFADLLVNYYTTKRFMQFKQVDAKKYAMHVQAGARKEVPDDMPHDSASVATNQQECNDDMQVVSPCVKSHRAPVSDEIEGAEEQLHMLGYK
jgi:hypothetical protein